MATSTKAKPRRLDSSVNIDADHHRLMVICAAHRRKKKWQYVHSLIAADARRLKISV
jgi:hypothetical protein